MSENIKTTEMAVPQGSGMVMQSEGFAGNTQMTIGETSAIAVAEQAKAAVQARYLMALRKPRNWDDVRTTLLKECRRSSFAPTAIYSKPVADGKVTGFSIRFAEAIMRAMTNLLPETYMVYDDLEKRIIRVMVTDLESNLTWSKDILIAKTVERKKVKDGQEVLGKRLNSYGQIVYIVRATEDDLLNKVNSAESKVLRNHALRLIPGDILDECRDQVEQTMHAEDRKDPDAARKKIVDAFASIGVKGVDIVAYIGHDLDRLQPSELTELRSMHQAIKDGEAVWSDYTDKDKGSGDEKPKDDKLQKVKDAVKEKLKGKDQKPETKQEQKPEVKQEPKPEQKHDVPKTKAPPPEKQETKEDDETISMINQAYNVAGKVLKNHELNTVLKAAQLPIIPYDKWAKDERVYGIYLMNEIIDKGGAPVFPDVPFWMDEKQGEIWSRNYRDTIGKAGLMREGELTA